MLAGVGPTAQEHNSSRMMDQLGLREAACRLVKLLALPRLWESPSSKLGATCS